MSELAPTTAPATPTAPVDAPDTSTPALDPGAPQNAVQAILAKRAAKDAAEAAQAPGDTPAPAAGSSEKPEIKEGEKPEAPGTGGLALKHAQLKADHRKVLAERETFKAELAAAAKERDELRGMFGPGKNHLRALEKAVGKPFKAIMEDAARGAYDERNALPPEQQAKLDAFDQWKAEQEAEKAQKQAAAARAEDDAVADEFMAANAERYPLFAHSGYATQELVERAYQELKEGKRPDLEAIARTCEEHAWENLERFFSNPPMMATLAKRPAVRQLWLQALGLSENTAARPASSKSGDSDAGNGPRTLSHTTTQDSPVPPPSSDEPEEDWLAGAKARLNQYKQHGRIGR